jgi:ABC-type uncharacterized transport system permease subunit
MRIPSIALIVAGFLLLGWGVVAGDSLSSTFSRAFSDGPSDKAILLIFSGVILVSLGTAGSFFLRRR